MSFHNAETGYSIHVINSFTYANATARQGAAGLLAQDVGKVALESDTNSYWVLQNNSPVTWSQLNGGGGGSGVMNYLTGDSSAFEGGIGSWITYANTPALRPVNGTGGSPTVTLAQSSSSPLVGTGSAVITKSSVNSQGQGVSVPFTIDPGYQTSLFSVSFVYNPSSGWNPSTGLAGSESDIEVWVYDVTNSVLIPVTPYKLITADGQNGLFQGNFQANSNSTSYRLILHIGTTNATAWTFKFDQVIVQPQSPAVVGAPVTDWTAYTPTFSAGFGTVTNSSMWYRRVGDSLQIKGSYSAGTVAGSPGTISLPPGLSIDLTKMSSTAELISFGRGWRQAATSEDLTTGPASIDHVYMYNGSMTAAVQLARAAMSGSFLGENASAILTSSDNVMIEQLTIPIVGWSSGVQFSNGTVTGAVEATIVNNGGTFGNATPITTGWSVQSDTNSSFSTSTGLYTVPVSGFYSVQWVIGNASSLTNAVLMHNGSSYLSGNNGARSLVSATLFCLAGDTLAGVIAGTTGTVNADNISTQLGISRVSGSFNIASSSIIASKYALGSNQTPGIGNPFNFATKVFDTTGSVSAGQLTCPVSGIYRVTCTWKVTAGVAGSMYVYHNGALDSAIGDVTVADVYSGSSLVQCLAGDILDVRSDANVTLDSSSSSKYCHLYFELIT
jgi:hypothetical protein